MMGVTSYDETQPNATQQGQEFEAFLMYLKQSRGFDFNVYQRPRLRQRLEKPLQALRIEGIRDYWDYLEGEPDEFTWLLNELLIQATAFFRDKKAWTYLSEAGVPQLVPSTYEKLEIANEEFQSTNKELKTLNDELLVSNSILQQFKDNFQTAGGDLGDSGSIAPGGSKRL